MIEMMQQPIPYVQDQQLDHLHAQVMALIDRLFCLTQEQPAEEGTKFHVASLTRLSHRLHEMAYLLMLARAERDGDMHSQDVARECAKISDSLVAGAAKTTLLPEAFLAVEYQSRVLAKQLDHIVFAGHEARQKDNMPRQQWRQIEAAFVTSTNATG